MLKNYITAAWRNLLKNKIFSLINISGLAIGMAAFILIAKYIQFELSYDKFHKNADNLYRVVFYRHYSTGLDKSLGNRAIVGQFAKENIPEVVDFSRCQKRDWYI